MAKLKFKKDNNLNISIPSIFIEKYLPKANGTYVKVYLYGLMCVSNPEENVTLNDIAKALDLIESDVYNAWKYWAEVGIVKINNNDTDFDIEFLDIINPSSNKMSFNNFCESKPNYSPKEIDIYINNNKEIKHLFKIARDNFGIIKNSNDSNILYSFYDWLRLPVEVIILLLEYCTSNNKFNMRYIEKVAIDWADKQIDSTEKAEAYLKHLEQNNKQLNIIKTSFGIIDRIFTPTELKYINTWIYDYKFDIEIIKLACEQTILSIGKPTIKYTHSILEEWNKKKIKTIEQANNEIVNFQKTNKEKYSDKKTKVNAPVNTKFNNFEQRKYDFDKIEKTIIEKRLKKSNESGAK